MKCGEPWESKTAQALKIREVEAWARWPTLYEDTANTMWKNCGLFLDLNFDATELRC